MKNKKYNAKNKRNNNSKKISKRRKEFKKINDSIGHKPRRSKTPTYEGVIMGTQKGFMFCRVDGKEDFFIAPKKTKGAINGDQVLIKVITETQESTEAQVIKILKRANQKLVGELFKYKEQLMFKADNPKISKYISISKRLTMGAQIGEKVVCNLIYQPENVKERFLGEIVEILDGESENEILELAIMREYDIYEAYPQEVIDQANKLFEVGITKEEKKTRLDLTDEEIFTIDGVTAKDFDDAVSLKMLDNGNYYLGVHIADVGHYVKRDTPLDKEAYQRGTSVYFPSMTFAMLPEALSNGICSLVEGEDRLTLSVFMEIDPNGEFVNHKIAETIISSKGRLTYKQVHQTLTGSEKSKADKFSKTLVKMNKLAKILKKKRRAAGELDFDIAEPYFTFNEDGSIKDVLKRERNDAHKLIEAFMIACNEVVAKEFHTLKSPFVYRIHEVPAKDKVQAVVDFLAHIGIVADKVPEDITPKYYEHLLKIIEGNDLQETINKVYLRSLQKAKYSPQCLGHFGLALEFYSHFTSPIRRYPDLVIHRIIKDYIKGRKQSTDLEFFVQDASNQSSIKEKQSEEAQRTADDLKKAEYMAKHIGEEFEGIITSVTNFGFFVELSNTIEGLVRLDTLPKDSYLFFEKSLKIKGTKNTYSLGDKVSIVVASANVYDRKIDFILSETAEKA